MEHGHSLFEVKEMKPKVRLVALECLQMLGVGYKERFAPVVAIATIRLISAIAAALDLEIEQMHVATAFLNGDLKEDIYMVIHEGLKNSSNAGKVCKLLKPFYGLKQSPRIWHFKMHEFLIEIGFSSSLNDPCFSYRHASSGIVLIGLYGGDLLIAGSSRSEIKSINNNLSQRFEMKGHGSC